MMKKIIYLLLAFALAITTACDPLDDVYAELDEQGEAAIVGDDIYTLVEADYEELELNYGTFNSISDAKTMLPSFLKTKYPVWGKGSSSLVTFKWYNKVPTYSEEVYTLSSQDHNDITGGSYGNFDKSYQVYDYLRASYPSPEEGDFVSLKYKYYAGSVSTITNGYFFDGEEWSKIAGFTPDEYNAMGESYPNFSSHDEAAIKIPITLLDVYKYDQKKAGDIVSAMYELYKGSGVTKSYTSNYIFDGATWAKYDNEADATVQFGHDGSAWIPDNTVKYTLVPTDYDYMAAELTGVAGYEDLVESLANYDDFDYNWTDDQVLEALGILLENIEPNAAEGQKYELTYLLYDNGINELTMYLIKTNGEWVLND